VLLGVGIVAVTAALISIAVGEGGPGSSQEIGGINDVQRIYGGIEQEDAYLGPADAETTVTFFNDLQCTVCAEYQVETIDPLVEDYARPGRARLEYRHFSLAPNDTTLTAIAAEAAGEQGRQWQYVDLFARNQDLAGGEVDDDLLREIADAVPELETSEWQAAFEDPAAEERVRQDAMLAAELELPAEPAVVVAGPGGQRELIETPSLVEIEEAISAVE
jgi:protein-disulfide isomerase